MEMTTLHLQLQDKFLIALIKTFFKRAVPICKPEELPTT
jgi:hypothetical protein